MAQRDPMFAQMTQMMNNPQVMQAMFNPQTLAAISQVQGGGQGVPGAAPPPPAPGAPPGTAPGAPPTPGATPTPAPGGAPGATPTPQGGAAPIPGAAPGAPGAPGAGGMPAFDPAMMQAMMQMMGGGGMGGGMGGMPQQNDPRPPEERYAAQIDQLVNMGFADRPSNTQALVQANGDINQAINFLLGG